MKKILVGLGLLLVSGASLQGATPLWMRNIKISPDGSRIAFTYKGDIYTVPVAGGSATRLTTNPAYDSNPVWSPDGSRIAFSSDREGGFDVYVMSASGGEAKRLTFNSASEAPMTFSPDGSKVVYAAAIQLPASSILFPSARNSQVWQVDVEGGRPSMLLGSPASQISFMPDGNSFVYMDKVGMENDFRKHHTSSTTRDLWFYNAKDGSHKNLTSRDGEDRNPVVNADGSSVYFLSERDGGSFNVWTFPLDNPSAARRLTDFTTHPVRFLSRANDGTLAFGYDGEIYTMNEKGGKPVKVNVDIVRDDSDPLHELSVNSARQSSVSPDGKQVAFVHRGDIFVTSTDYPTTRQITHTGRGESAPSWGADNRSLYYTSDRDGHSNIYRARIHRKEDPNFPNAMLIEETPVFTDGVARQDPLVSPNGQLMAFIQEGNKIGVIDLTTRKITMLTQGETSTYKNGGIELDWSPDSEWLAATVDVHQRSPYYDIALFNVSTGEMTNITDDAYSNSGPRWVMGGNAIIFSSDRYGMKNHASWGSTDDVLMVFVNREALDRYRLSDEDYALLKEAEKSAKKPAASGDDPKAFKIKASGKKGGAKAKAEADRKADTPADHVNVELDGIQDRIIRLTPFSAQLSDAWVDPDGEALYWLAKVDDGFDVWKKELRKGSVSLFKKLGLPAASFQPDASGKNLFILSGSLRKMGIPSGKVDNISVRGTHLIDPAAERDYMYDYMLEQEQNRFLVEDMFGVDWKGLGEDYRKFLPHINNNYDYSEMLSELLGELNVSHTGSGYRPENSPVATASLGLLYDTDYAGPGLKVAEVLKSGPFDRAKSAMVAGAIITSINGETLDKDSDPLAALNRLVGTKTLVTFTLPSGKQVEEVVKPVGNSFVGDILYERWVERNRHLVDSLSGGRLGYVHIKSMDDPSYRRIYADVLGRYAQREGIVIDTRYNGGGRLHEDIEVLFSGKKYLTQEIRGVKSGEMPSKRWLRPSIMITCEANYSNAHGTPWMYKHNKLGKVVGMPVPGTMSSVNWVTLQDPSLYFGIPVVGFRTAEGNLLENTQLEPDVKVENNPARTLRGIDDQLSTAVSTLLHDIDAK